MRTTAPVTTLRSSLARRRTERQSRRLLTSELAAFDTPSDWLELEAIVARHSAEDSREVRAIMNQISAERATR